MVHHVWRDLMRVYRDSYHETHILQEASGEGRLDYQEEMSKQFRIKVEGRLQVHSQGEFVERKVPASTRHSLRASGKGTRLFLCQSLCQAPWSVSSVMACAPAALTVRPCPGGTRAGGLQSPVLASHSPKALSNAIKGENLPLLTCCLLKSLEWERCSS